MELLTYHIAAFSRYMLAVVTAMACLAGVLTGVMAQDPPTSIIEKYNSQFNEREAMIVQLQALEIDYRDVVQRIDAIKRTSQNSLHKRRELEALMRQARQLANALETQQQAIMTSDKRLELYRKNILESLKISIDAARSERASLNQNNDNEQQARIEHLESLYHRFNNPLESPPIVAAIDEILATINAEDTQHDPAHLLAAADELEDTEDIIRQRLKAIEAQIKRSRANQLVQRRARNFSREDNFFDEQHRSRVIARYQRPVTNSGPRDESANESPSSDSPVDEQATAGDSFDADDSAAPPSESGSWNEPETDLASPPNAGNSPDIDAPPQINTPGTRRENIAFHSGADPELSQTTNQAEEHRTKPDLRQLEDEYNALLEQADQLREKAKTLRQQAREAMQ